MNRKLLLLAGVASSFYTAGCVQINHSGYDTAIRTIPDQPIPPPLRSQVHLFILNGIDPLEDGPMLKLRDELARCGYAKVYYAQRADVAWYHREMHRVVHDQPAARLVLVGYGAGATRARELACTVRGDGLPLDSLALLDPTADDEISVLDDGVVPTVVVRSHHWPAGRGVPAGEVVELAGVGHLSLPNHPQTVAVLSRLMAESATRVELGPPDALPHLPLREHPQPTPRPVMQVIAPPTS